MTSALPLDGVSRPHSSHWGAFRAALNGEELRIAPHPDDPAPSPLLENFTAALRHRARVTAPMVRQGWLERGPGAASARGRETFVEVSWEKASDLVATELRRVYAEHGAGSVFGGSYGWSSAGRFHHAQSQIHRFLNCAGGYVRSVNSYSSAAAAVILPHVIGPQEMIRDEILWADVERHPDILLCFGGMAAKNGQSSAGGISRHSIVGSLKAARTRGAEFHLFGPQPGDLPAEAQAQWHASRPGADVAVMLGLAHSLLACGAVDHGFLDRCTVGFETFAAYLSGAADGQPKSAEWASAISGVPAETIHDLALRLKGKRSLVVCAQSLQRAEHGEQPVWMGVVLAAMLGQIGLPGSGFAYGLGSIGNIGKPAVGIAIPKFPQGVNAVGDFIPVARIADMLLHPGESYHFNGRERHYPKIRLLYWAGGNPFHHHQDINRLRRAFAQPETVIVHESAWTATARHADIVLPATMTLERNDIGGASDDPLLTAMHQLAPPPGQARDDFDILTGIADRLGFREAFTGNRSSNEWLSELYGQLKQNLIDRGHPCPDFERFWQDGEMRLPLRISAAGHLAAFRENPQAAPLPTPSGRIEIVSTAIEGFGYDDCLAHPTWFAPREGHASAYAADYPLQLIANQPATRLHSQLDFGNTSIASKVAGREPIRIHRSDAAARGITEGAVVRVFNSRGTCLAGAVLTSDIAAGVVQLATGAWYDPADAAAADSACVHGNPNMLTRDAGTSQLAQGCSGALTQVEIALFIGPVPPVKAFDPPLSASFSIPTENKENQ